MISGWLMTRFGWNGIVVFGVVLGIIASIIHIGGRKA
jgi:MFS-type transporter involved in bile tolerance (Atg22 family)